MRKFWKEYHGDIIGVVVAVIMATIAAVWALVRSWEGPLVVPLVIGVFALTLFSTNQWHVLSLRWQKRNLDAFFGVNRPGFRSKPAGLSE